MPQNTLQCPLNSGQHSSQETPLSDLLKISKVQIPLPSHKQSVWKRRLKDSDGHIRTSYVVPVKYVIVPCSVLFIGGATSDYFQLTQAAVHTLKVQLIFVYRGRHFLCAARAVY